MRMAKRALRSVDDDVHRVHTVLGINQWRCQGPALRG